MGTRTPMSSMRAHRESGRYSASSHHKRRDDVSELRVVWPINVQIVKRSPTENLQGTQADNSRKRKATFIGTTTQYKNKSDARVAVEALLLRLNEEKPQHHRGAVTFGAICDRYIEEELPQRYSTRKPICRISSCTFAQGGSATCCTRSGPWWSKAG